MSGSAIIDEVTQASYDAEGGIYTHGVAKSDNPAMRAASYPTSDFKNRSPMDEDMQQRAEMVKAGGGTGMTPFGQLQVTDRELDWLQKKRETAEAANLDAWIGAHFNINDVATRAWLQRTYPQYFERREEEMVRRSKFALRVNLLLMRGPRNRKDLILQWGLQTGRVKLDENWDRIGPHLSDGQNFDNQKAQKRYRNGLFSIRRYQTSGERKKNAEASDNPFRVEDNATGSRYAQLAGPFPGGVVNNPRYPDFIKNVITSSYNQ